MVCTASLWWATITQETALTTTIPSLPCELLVCPLCRCSYEAQAYLLAVQTTVVGADGEELVTSNGETVRLDGAGVAEAGSQGADLLGRDLNSLISVRGSGNGRDETKRVAYRETGGTSLNAGAVVAEDGGLVKLAGAHQAVKVVSEGCYIMDADGGDGSGVTVLRDMVPGVNIA